MARCPPHCFSIACAQSKTCPTFPLSVRPVPYEVLFKLMEQNVRRSGLFDKERRLEHCELRIRGMTVLRRVPDTTRQQVDNIRNARCWC